MYKGGYQLSGDLNTFGSDCERGSAGRIQKLEPEIEDFGAKSHFKIKLNLEQLQGGTRNFHKSQRKRKLKLRQLRLAFERQAFRKLKLSQNKGGEQVFSRAVASGYPLPRG